MRGAAVALGLSLFAVAPAVADTIDVLKANTLVLHHADGKVFTLLVKEDADMEQVNGAGMWAAGFWGLNGQDFCWTARGESAACIPLPADKTVGDRWEIRNPLGKLIWTAEIQEGRADLKAVAAQIKAAKSAAKAGAEGHE